MTFKLKSVYKPAGDQPQAIEKLVAGIKAGQKNQVLLGVTGSGKTFTMANVIQQTQLPTLVLAHNKTLAAQLYEEYKSFFPENAVRYYVSYYDYYQPEAYLPTSDTYIEKTADINEEIERMRLSSMNALLTRKDVIIVASVSCIYNTGRPVEHEKQKIFLQKGKQLDQVDLSIHTLAQKLANIQYTRGDLDLRPGTFQIMGDTIFVYPPYQEHAWRIEFFGDEIEEIRAVDPLTRNVIFSKKAIEIYPAKAYVVEQKSINKGMKKIKKDLTQRVKELEKNGRLVEAKRLQQRTGYDLGMLTNAGYCSGIENYSRYFDGRKSGDPPFSLLGFFPKDYLLIADESHMSLPQVRGMFNGDQARKRTLVDYGFRLPSALDNRPLQFSEFINSVDKIICTTATPADWEMERSKQEAKNQHRPSPIIEQIVRPTGLIDPPITVLTSKGQIERILKIIKDAIHKKGRILITTVTKKLAEDLSQYLENKGIKTTYLHSEITTLDRVQILQDLRQGKYDVLVGVNLLREGIDLPEVNRVVILDADKQGFLRSKSSLIQLIGRAARNVDGQVYLFADKYLPSDWTPAMQGAISEAKRRRKIQVEYNKKHNITPRSVQKEIKSDLLDSLDTTEQSTAPVNDLASKWDKEELNQKIKKLKQQMKLASEHLEFETAARLRDRINKLKDK